MKDLTKGSPGKQVFMFALPLALGTLLQLAYSLTDTRIIGLYLGEQALAGVGATTTLSSLLVNFLNGITNGFAILISINFGKKTYDKMRQAEGNAILIALILSVLITVASVGYLEPILHVLRVPTEAMEEGLGYIRIILLGLTASMLYNVCAGILRAIGDTVTPLIFLLISTILNVGFDLLFILVFKLGVEGAAYATVLAQFLAFLACAIYMWCRYEILRFGPSDMKLYGPTVKFLLSSGLSMGLMSSLVNFGSLILQSGINGLGNTYIIAHTGARKISEIFMLPFGVFGMTMATYCSQNYGAGRYDRIYLGFRKAVQITFIWCAGVLVCSYTIAPYLVKFVVATKTALVIDTATHYLRINTLFYLVCTIVCLGRNALQGVGIRKTPVISSFLELAGKAIAVFLLVPRLDYEGVVWAEPISWIIMVLPLLVSLIPRYRMWKQSAKSQSIKEKVV